MSLMNTSRSDAAKGAAPDFDAIVIGAGFGGLRMLHELRRLGLSAKVLEAGTDIGGTWYWNRYPGARTDSESWVYCYSFSKQLEQEWNWSERYPSQPEVLRYLGHVADRFDMRKDIEFAARVRSAIYDETANQWTIAVERGRSYTCRYFITAVGLLSQPYKPPFPGLDSFEGEWLMTARWPKREVDFTGKRVGIIGAGATAVQAVPIIAETAAQLTVFQRTPNYVLPARNHSLDDSRRRAIKHDYANIWALTQKHFFAFPMVPANRVAGDVSPEERDRIFEAAWQRGGFGYLFETFDDILVDERSNDAAAEFIRRKIRETVKDPITAELLCPKTYPLAGKRPPLGHGYYETFNRDNVTLVDVRTSPIREITPKGLRTETDEYALDVIVFATGFDAATGSLAQIDIRGRRGESLKDKWTFGPKTYLGMGVHGFPNMFLICGPQSPFANIPVVIDNVVRWIGRAIERLRAGGLDRLEATPEAADAWGVHMEELVHRTVLPRGEDVGSWFLGANIPGKPHVVLFYFGGAGAYFDRCREVADRDFEGFVAG
jgi:cation diffusion facilitator CzcD-associated flavoprotein CzcO